MPKINQEEYEVLKGLDDERKWMARDENGQLYKFLDKPRKINDFSWNDPLKTWLRINDDNFKFIQWEDEEPHNIAELIEEYEYSADHVSHVVNERVKALGNAWKESEETEVKKDIEWLKREIHKELETWHGVEGGIDGDGINEIMLLINQLDEPEVLSQEFINEKAVEVYADTADTEVHVVFRMRDLQNLLVPKQEEVDRAYKDGYEEGREHGFYKGYREGLANKGSEPETVADVVTTFWKSYERLKEVMSMEVEELE